MHYNCTREAHKLLNPPLLNTPFANSHGSLRLPVLVAVPGAEHEDRRPLAVPRPVVGHLHHRLAIYV